MGYSARRGFSSGSMKATGAQRQAEVQQKIAQMQEAMNTVQEEVEARSFTASVGGGAVEAVANGRKELVSLTIKPEAVDPEDVEMLQAGEAMDKAMDGITGGLGLGGLGI